MTAAAPRPGSSVWLFRALGAGVLFLIVWLGVQFGPRFDKAELVQGIAAACLAICLIVAAVAFVLEVVRRVTSA
jgi:hypothetical protein